MVNSEIEPKVIKSPIGTIRSLLLNFTYEFELQTSHFLIMRNYSLIESINFNETFHLNINALYKYKLLRIDFSYNKQKKHLIYF